MLRMMHACVCLYINLQMCVKAVDEFFVCMCMYVCVHAHTCMCVVHACMDVFACLCLHMHVYLWVSAHVSPYECTCVYGHMHRIILQLHYIQLYVYINMKSVSIKKGAVQQ